MALSATRLHQDLYRILDEVLETGIPVDIEHNGRIIRLVPKDVSAKLDRLEAHRIIAGDPEDLVHVDWLAEWAGGHQDP